MAEAPPTVALVVPCYNEEAVLPETAVQLSVLLDRLMQDGRIGPASHVCFVDDGSSDGTWGVIAALGRSDPRFGGIRLSRNRGHQNALLAGMFSAQGDVVISIDADLQDDVAAIESMLDAHAAGNEIVYGARKSRDSDTLFKRSTAKGFYGLLHRMGVEAISDHASRNVRSRRTHSSSGPRSFWMLASSTRPLT